MKEMNEATRRVAMNLRMFNIVLSLTVAALTFPGWASLFFVVCALVAWSDKPQSEEDGREPVRQ